jgi:dTMP kinase
MFDLTSLYAPALEGPGIFIVVEGLDGAGKSIQITRLMDRMLIYGHLGGVNEIHNMRQPTTGQYGQKIREFAGSSKERKPLVEFTIFLADRMEQAKKVRDHISHGEVIIMDRCYHTSVAYQSVTGELDPWEIFHANRIVFPKPDLLIMIDIDPDVAMDHLHRRGRAKEVFERKDFFIKAREVYLELTKREDGVVINGDQTIDKVEEDIWKAFMAFLPTHPRR